MSWFGSRKFTVDLSFLVVKAAAGASLLGDPAACDAVWRDRAVVFGAAGTSGKIQVCTNRIIAI